MYRMQPNMWWIFFYFTYFTEEVRQKTKEVAISCYPSRIGKIRTGIPVMPTLRFQIFFDLKFWDFKYFLIWKVLIYIFTEIINFPIFSTAEKLPKNDQAAGGHT